MKRNRDPWNDTRLNLSKSVNLHIDCLSADSADGIQLIEEDQEYTMSATITLRVDGGFGRTDTWQVNEYESNFEHMPEEDPEENHGIGATDDGETFSGNCNATGGDEWQSLLITTASYDEVLWWIHAPGDTSLAGTYIEVDSGGAGDMDRAAMTYRFPEDVGGPGEEAAYFKIRAEIWLNDGSGYEEFYNVWVTDKK